MATKKKLLQAAAGAAGGAGLNVEDVFSTFVADATGSGALTINNGIDLSGEGGIVWVKSRNNSHNHYIFDPNVGSGGYLIPNSTTVGLTGANYTFTSTGLTDTYNNYSNNEAVWWTFRKAPKFFDVVTYTGNGSAGQNISHNLGCVPGCVIFKRLDAATDWLVWHRKVNGTDADGSIRLNTTAAKANGQPWDWDGVTDTYFPIISDWTEVNASGGSYVAYFFAHNDGDGDFGPDADQDIIKCGSFTTDSSGNATINLGFEPQFVINKTTSSADSWTIADSMRGFNAIGDQRLYANLSNAEATATTYRTTSTGFTVNSGETSKDFIYIAIRRGPMAVPESATDVFAVDAEDSGSFNNPPLYVSDFPVDFALRKQTNNSSSWIAADRLRGDKRLKTDATDAEDSFYLLSDAWDYMDGWNSDGGWNAAIYSWMWRRAPNFFDVVAYTGDGSSSRNVNHNLGAVPEMMWVKSRNNTASWIVYHKDIGNTKAIYLNSTSAASTASSGWWNNTTPTDTVFTLGANTTQSSNNYIAYLFATLAGVSKVGSVSHTNGTDTNVDCGFSSGARFILIKRSSGTGSWYVFDTERGIVAGDDKGLYLQSTAAEQTADWIDPYSSGFTMVGASFDSGTYVFYAIA